MLLDEVHVFLLEDINGVLINILSIVFNLNKVTHMFILGLQLNS